jgi:hypothetical protein
MTAHEISAAPTAALRARYRELMQVYATVAAEPNPLTGTRPAHELATADQRAAAAVLLASGYSGELPDIAAELLSRRAGSGPARRDL